MSIELYGSVREIQAADRVYGLRLVQGGATTRLEQVNTKNRFGILEPVKTLCTVESNGNTVYRIIRK